MSKSTYSLHPNACSYLLDPSQQPNTFLEYLISHNSLFPSSAPYEPQLLFILSNAQGSLLAKALRVLPSIVSPKSMLQKQFLNLVIRTLKEEHPLAVIHSALGSLTGLVTEYDYADVWDVATLYIRHGTLCMQQKALCVLYRVRKHKYGEFVQILTRSLFNQQLSPLVLNILRHVTEERREFIEPLIPLLISELPHVGPRPFYTLCSILAVFINENELYTHSLESALCSFFDTNQDLAYYIGSISIAREIKGESPLHQLFGQRLQSFVNKTGDINTDLLIVECLLALYPIYRPKAKSLAKLMDSPDTVIRQAVFPMLDQNSNSTITTLGTFVYEIINKKTSYLLKKTLDLSPHCGVWFAETVFDLYQADEANGKQIARVLQEVADEPALESIFRNIRMAGFEFPDDPFGYALAYLISQNSDCPEDFYLLLGCNIGQRTQTFQKVAIYCAALLWNRLKFEIDDVGMGRLMRLTHSTKREIRTISRQFRVVVYEYFRADN